MAETNDRRVLHELHEELKATAIRLDSIGDRMEQLVERLEQQEEDGRP